jgi:hypothetical protein
MPDFLADALTWPQNYRAAIAVQTAYDMGVPPLTFLKDDSQPTDKWTDADKKLLMAWTILQKETCQECGQPLWICRSNNNNLTFSVRKGLCYAKLAMEKWKDTSAGKNTKPGEVPYVLPSRYDETLPLPSRRDYLQQLAEDE